MCKKSKWFYDGWDDFVLVGSGAKLPGKPLSTMKLEQLFDLHDKRLGYAAFKRVCVRMGVDFSVDDCEFWVCEVRKTWKKKLPPYKGTGKLTCAAVDLIRSVLKAIR